MRISMVYLSVLVIMGGCFTFGISIAFSALTMPAIVKEFRLNELESTMFSALIALFAIAGPFTFQYCMTTKGRKYTFNLISIGCAISWFMFVIANQQVKYLIFIHRITIGLLIGAYSAVNPVYLTELANDEQKSLFGTLNQLGISAGVVASNIFGGLLPWRVFAIGVFLFCTLIAVSSFFIADVKHMQAKSAKHTDPAGSCSILFTRYRMELIEGVMYQFLQQFSGINGVLTNAGMLLNNSTTAATFAASAQLIACVFCSSAINKLGTKLIWIIACAGAAASLVILAISQTFKLGLIVNGIAVFGFQLSFGFGLGPLPFTISPNLFPDSVRAQALSILTGVNWLLAFVVISIFPTMLNNYGLSISSLIFAGVLAAGVIFGLKQENIAEKDNDAFEPDIENHHSDKEFDD